MDRISLLWTLALTLAGLTLVNSQTSPAKVPTPEIAARIGSAANFSCESFGVPITYCLWERPAVNNVNSQLVSFTPGATQASQGGYGYTGAGLEKGSCGLVISNVKDFDNAVWDCKLITNAGIYQGAVRVGILKKPSAPEFSTSIDQLRNLVDTSSNPTQPQTKVNATCGSHGGQPPPKFKWVLGDKELTPASGVQFGPYINATDAAGNVWTQQDLMNYKFTWKDSGKELKCIVVHDALTEADRKEVSIVVNVNYMPRLETELSPIFVPAVGDEAVVAINITANPLPQIHWEVDGKMIHPKQLSADGRYKGAEIVDRGNGVWECKLLIAKLLEEDLPKTYKLIARNQIGTETFPLRITTSNPDAGGMSAGGIVGLVLGIPLLLIIIAVIVVYTRARGLLCFKGDDGTASEKERMDGESAGGGAAAEEKPASRRLSSRLSAIYENLVSKKKDKTAPVDEEANKEKDKEAPEVPAEKKPDDIVYAELDLVTEGKQPGVVRGNEDKTEYAEIIGVAPQAGTDPKDKSPTCSAKASPKK